MTPLMEKALEAIRGWLRNRQNAAAHCFWRSIAFDPSAHRASAEELAAIDEALEQVARGERPMTSSQKLRP